MKPIDTEEISNLSHALLQHLAEVFEKTEVVEGLINMLCLLSITQVKIMTLLHREGCSDSFLKKVVDTLDKSNEGIREHVNELIEERKTYGNL